MRVIKEFLSDSYDFLTSFVSGLHRWSITVGRATWPPLKIFHHREHRGSQGRPIYALLCVPLCPLCLGFCGSRLRVEIHRLHGQIPVRVEDFEAPLLFALEGFLIGIHLLLERGFAESFICPGAILQTDGHPQLPPPTL